MRADRISREAQRPSLLANVKVHACASLVSKCGMVSERSLRKEIRVARQPVRPNLDAARSLPPESRPACCHNEFRSATGSRTKRADELPIDTDPPSTRVVIQAKIEAVRVIRELRLQIETEKRIAEVGLQVVRLENALDE